MAPTYREMWPIYAREWDLMQITPSRIPSLKNFAKRAMQGKARYQEVEAITSVPWWMIAIIAERESSQNWTKSLAQGDSWNRRSTHVPKGLGPYKSWKDAAVDTLHRGNLDIVHDWPMEKAFFYFERINGWGYHDYHAMPSPYVWGATSIQKRGKYIRDRVFSSSTWDMQLGCAAMLWSIMSIDPSVKPIRET